MSGFASNQLSGQQVLLRSIAYYRIAGLELLPTFLGASFEYGNVFEDRSNISLDPEDALLSASLFLGFDPPLGPLYQGYGHTEQG